MHPITQLVIKHSQIYLRLISVVGEFITAYFFFQVVDFTNVTTQKPALVLTWKNTNPKYKSIYLDHVLLGDQC